MLCAIAKIPLSWALIFLPHCGRPCAASLQFCGCSAAVFLFYFQFMATPTIPSSTKAIVLQDQRWSRTIWEDSGWWWRFWGSLNKKCRIPHSKNTGGWGKPSLPCEEERRHNQVRALMGSVSHIGTGWLAFSAAVGGYGILLGIGGRQARQDKKTPNPRRVSCIEIPQGREMRGMKINSFFAQSPRITKTALIRSMENSPLDPPCILLTFKLTKWPIIIRPSTSW